MSGGKEIQALLFPGTNQGEQAGKIQRAFLGATAKGCLAGDHRRAQGPFRRVVVGGDFGLPQPQQQLIALLEDTARQALTITIRPGTLGKVIQALLHRLL